MFSEIVRRVEQLRIQLGLNKAQFTAAIEMKPQTYNNFVGIQRSKPSVELLQKVVSRFGANPAWLLTGQGDMYLSVAERALVFGVAGRRGEQSRFEAPLTSALAPLTLSPHFGRVLESISRLEGGFSRSDTENVRLLHGLVQAMAQYLIQNPDQARIELTAVLQRIVTRLSGQRPSSRTAGNWVCEEMLHARGTAGQSPNTLSHGALGADTRIAGELKVTTTDTLAFGLLNRHLNRFGELYPDIRIQLIVQNRFLSLSSGEADVAIRPSAQVHEGGVVRRLLSGVAAAVYASMDYTAAHGRPSTVSELKRHKVVTGDESLRHAVTVKWIMGHALEENIVYRSNSLIDQLRALRGGFGVAAMPCFLADPDDRLVRLFPPEPLMANELWLLVHRELHSNPCVQVFSDFLYYAIGEDRDLLEGRLRKEAA